MRDTPNVLMIGAGGMAVAYSKVLTDLDIDPIVLGRGEASALEFEKATGTKPRTGHLSALLNDTPTDLDAIVTVNAHALTEVTKQLIHHGMKRILVEKPAALDLAEMDSLLAEATAANCEIYVAYNRRFLSSVIEADRIIAEDGGVLSLRFDFSEPAKRIAALDKNPRELATWFYGNSTHVVDLAFHFFGDPSVLNCYTSGKDKVPWHPDASVFTGIGKRADGALLSWHSNWASPGRWGMEVLTKDRRIIMQPLEKLRIQTHENFSENEVQLDDEIDQQFKPGLWKQTQAFLFHRGSERLVKLEDHAKRMKFYEAIRLGTDFSANSQ